MNGEIRIDGQIGESMFGGPSVTAADFVAQIEAAQGPVTVRLNSPGGSVTEGMTIADAIRKARANVHIVGQAASIASFIAVHGERVTAAPSAFIMIHNAWQFAQGDADELRKQAEVLDKVSDSIAQAYSRKTGLSLARIQELMDAETWFTAEEALAVGLIDAIVDGAVATTRSKFGELAPAHVLEQALASAQESKKQAGTLFGRPTLALAAYNAALTQESTPNTVSEESLKAKVAELEKSVTEAEARAKAAEQALAERDEQDVKAAAGRAEKELRGTPELRAQILASSAKSGEKVQLLNGLSGSPASVPSQLKAYVNGGKSSEAREGWSFRDWSNRDLAGLNAMKVENPEAYKQLYQNQK